MSKIKKASQVARRLSEAARPSRAAAVRRRHAHAVRETVESIVIAFVLAFLFRTFEAEAFVIPTGSMAPTLMGRHKDVDCPKCGYRFQVNASEEDGEELLRSMAQLRSRACTRCTGRIRSSIARPAASPACVRFAGTCCRCGPILPSDRAGAARSRRHPDAAVVQRRSHSGQQVHLHGSAIPSGGTSSCSSFPATRR